MDELLLELRADKLSNLIKLVTYFGLEGLSRLRINAYVAIKKMLDFEAFANDLQIGKI